MISLSVEQLRDYQRRTMYIQKNTTLPSLAYLKLERRNNKHYITKSNLRCTCVALVNSTCALAEHETLLLDDRIFMSFINLTKSQDVIISWDESQIKLSDGRNNVKFAKQNPTDFPKTPSFAGAQANFTFNKKHLDAISIAKNFVLNTESGGNYKFVHVGDNFISAFHTNYFYINNQFQNLPVIRIDAEMAEVITGIEELKFAHKDNHYFFLATNMIYIFTMQEGNSPNVKSVFDRFAGVSTEKNFTLNKEDVLEFCNMSNMVTEAGMADCSFYPDTTKVDLKLVDSSYNREVHKSLDLKGSMDQFNFDSKLLIGPMKSIPYDVWKCKTVQNNFMITGENEYFNFMGLAPKVMQ